MPQPQDIQPQYLNIARRLQAAARGNGGVAIVSLRYIIDDGGNVVCWPTPKVTLLEPKGNKDEILELLTED